MKKAIVTVSFSGEIQIDLDNLGRLVNDQIKDIVMELIAMDSNYISEASDFDIEIKRY
ncbi:MAG TPA: hypothetical protein K8U70_07085 [Facklamia tabacinasalis]|nr:hypothetical protein [Ruoffia tabacinasalis]